MDLYRKDSSSRCRESTGRVFHKSSDPAIFHTCCYSVAGSGLDKMRERVKIAANLRVTADQLSNRYENRLRGFEYLFVSDKQRNK